MNGLIQKLQADINECCSDNLEWHPEGPAELIALERASKLMAQTTDEFLKSF